jgi:hypothetical protein
MPVRRYGAGSPQNNMRLMAYNPAERAVLIVSVDVPAAPCLPRRMPREACTSSIKCPPIPTSGPSLKPSADLVRAFCCVVSYIARQMCHLGCPQPLRCAG